MDYGGSTGYGRAYRDSLKGNWGLHDVTDCEAAALHLARRLDMSRATLSRVTKELIALGFVPGPKIGKILEFVQVEQLEGRLSDRETALEILREKFVPD